MEAGMATAGPAMRSAPIMRTEQVEFLAEQGPGFIPPDLHGEQLDVLRRQAQEAHDFHVRKADEARAVIQSCDHGLATLAELRKTTQPGY